MGQREAHEEVEGGDRAEEGAALAERAPLDLRVNLLKGTREEALAELSETLLSSTDIATSAEDVA